ncbi:unnamed protein product [Trichobilharzia szidati]|nr:unnamed protein product [Trichobilharzia szidati]
MIVILEANESFGAQWTAYAAITCLVWTVILCVFLFLVFKNNLRISLILIGIIIALLSAAICFMYCQGPDIKYMSQLKYFELIGGFWNTTVAILALVFASSLK